MDFEIPGASRSTEAAMISTLPMWESTREEVNVATGAQAGLGVNYGWNIMEDALYGSKLQQLGC